MPAQARLRRILDYNPVTERLTFVKDSRNGKLAGTVHDGPWT